MALDLHLNQTDTWLNRGSLDQIQSTALISRVITVEIKRDQNASEASDEDPMDAFSRRSREHVASS